MGVRASRLALLLLLAAPPERARADGPGDALAQASALTARGEPAAAAALSAALSDAGVHRLTLSL